MITFRRSAVAFLALALAPLAIGCDKRDASGGAASASASAATTARAPGAVAVDPEVAKRIHDIVASCSVDESSVSGCKGDQEWAPMNYAAEKKLTNFFESLAEMALTEGATDKKVFTAIVATWNTFKDDELEKKNATPAAAERVLKLVELVPDSVDRFAYAAAVPLLAGQREKLTAALEKKKPGSSLRAKMYNSYLEYGGVAALPDVQAFYTKATSDDERFSAVWAVGVANYKGKVKDPDRTKMCDWAKSLVGDANPRVFQAAADSLGRCGGPYIDAILTAADARVAKEKMTEPSANALKATCWREDSLAPVNGTKEQCAKAMAILEKGVNAKDVPPGGLRQAMWSIGIVGKYGEGQNKKAKELLGKFQNNKDKSTADAAKYGLKGLT